MELNVLNVAKVIMSLVGKNKSISSIRLSNIIYYIWRECKMVNFDFEATFYDINNTGIALCKELHEYNDNDFLCYSDFKEIKLTKDDERLKKVYRNIIKNQILIDYVRKDKLLDDDELVVINSYDARRFTLYCLIFDDFNNTENIDDSEIRDVLEKRYNILESCINLSNETLYAILNGYILGLYSDKISLGERVIRCCRKMSLMDFHYEENDDEFYIDSKFLDDDETVYLNVTVFDTMNAQEIIPKYEMLKEVIHDNEVLFFAL